MLNVQIGKQSITFDRVLYCKKSSNLTLYRAQNCIATIPPQCKEWAKVASAIQNWKPIRLSSQLAVFSE